ADARVGRLVVWRGAQVAEQRALGQHHEAVGETLGDPELALVLRAEDGRGPAPEMRRTTADVHRHVVDLALQHADQLALRVGPLVMQAAQHPARGQRYVALHETGRQAVFGIALRVPGFVEEATRIAEHRRFDHHAARQVGLHHLHGTTVPRRASSSRYWP